MNRETTAEDLETFIRVQSENQRPTYVPERVKVIEELLALWGPVEVRLAPRKTGKGLKHLLKTWWVVYFPNKKKAITSLRVIDAIRQTGRPIKDHLYYDGGRMIYWISQETPEDQETCMQAIREARKQ